MKKKTKIIIIFMCSIFICLFIVNNVVKKEKVIIDSQEIQIDKGELRICATSIIRYDSLKEYEDYNDTYLFVENKIDAEPDVYYYEEVDWDRLYEENNQYKDYGLHPEKYSIDEAIKINNEIDGIMYKYTSRKERKCDFVFVECNIENVDSKDIIYGINDQILIKRDGDEWEEYLPIYFTKSDTNNNDNSFFIKNIRKKENFNYVLGYAIPEDRLDGEWYWGDYDVMVDPETEEQLNPVLQDMYVKKIEIN